MRDLQDAFDAADLVVRRADGFVPDTVLTGAVEVLSELRGRGARAHSALLIALAGGTGSGKSSVLNAIAGEPIASVGRLRPHTEEPLAWIPLDRDPTLAAVLSELGIIERHTHDVIAGVAILDMPDMDSIALDHRLTVERLIPIVDGLIWVLDPEKYNDPILHDAFLAPLAPYAAQTAFVLNKIDRLRAADRDAVTDNVRTLLDGLGYKESPLFVVSAVPPDGEPVGIEALTEFLGSRLDHKRTTYGKLLGDLAGVIKRIGTEADVWRGSSIRMPGRWTVAREAAIAALRPSNPAPSEDALCRIEDLVAAAAAEIGGQSGDRIRTELDHDIILEALTGAQKAIANDSAEVARDELDMRIGRPIREVLWDRAYLSALVAHAHIGVRQVASRFGVSVS